jgi:cysteine desulfurase
MNTRKLCYFDNNATTRIAPEVLEAMLPFLTERWGNPSSAYAFGKEMGVQIEAARNRVAALINADPKELVFTGCGTESINSALNSALWVQPGKRHIITTAVEHSATLKVCQFLQKQECEVTYLPVESDGSLDLHLLDQSIRPDTALVSVMWANNETGVIFPVEEIAAICRSRGVMFHTDAVQAAGKVRIDVETAGPDMLSLSAHKLHAPKGVGVLYIRRHTKYQPYLLGGHQERGRRGGTENVASIVAFGRAAQMAMSRLNEESGRVKTLRDRFELGILKTIPGAIRNGAQEPRLPNTTNIAFDGVEAEAVLLALDRAGICASSGSACTTGSVEPSHVLTAMGVNPSLARGSLRFSLGLYNTAAEVDYVLRELPPIISQLRAQSPAAKDTEPVRRATNRTEAAFH